MSICQCPLSTALPTIPSQGCAKDFGQIQKIVFQRLHKTGATKNSFTSTAQIEKLASWTTLKTASDGSKIAITPYVEAPTPDGGDPVTFGGGNDTLGGITKIIGRNPVGMTFALRQVDQSIIKALKAMQCETDLGVFFLNGDGQILALKDASAASTYYPIPIQSLFVGDLKLNGLSSPDDNALQFALAPNWSDDAEIVTPEFNPLTDL